MTHTLGVDALTRVALNPGAARIRAHARNLTPAAARLAQGRAGGL